MSVREEDCIQKAIIEWLSYKHPKAREVVIHIANQRATSPQQGYKLKQMGVRKGVSDLLIPIATGGYHGMFLEVKTIEGTLTKEQKAFIKRMDEEGYFAIAAYGLEHCMREIDAYLTA